MIVQEWRSGGERAGSPSRKLHLRSPTEACNEASWDLAIVLPRTRTATQIVRQILSDGRPACMLVPSDLAHLAAQEPNGSFDPKIYTCVRECAKISLLSAGMVWLITPNVGASQHQVFAGEETPGVKWNPAIGTRAECGCQSNRLRWLRRRPSTSRSASLRAL